MSTAHTAVQPSGRVVRVLRREPDGSLVGRACPPCLPHYVQFMRGVDRGDQLSSYYNIGRRSKKWWRRLFFYLVECCVLNAYVLDSWVRPLEHKKKGWAKRDFLAFRHMYMR